MLHPSPDLLITQLKTVPGLDVDIGLVYLQGRIDSYWRILSRFAAEHHQDAHKIKELLDTGQIGAAERMSHSLKGVAATLGATRVQTSAATLNLFLKSGNIPPQLPALLADLSAGLDGLCTAIESLSPSLQDEDDTFQVLDDQLLKELSLLLANGDMRASRMFEQQKKTLAHALGKDFAALSEAMACFDYETAHRLITKLKA